VYEPAVEGRAAGSSAIEEPAAGLSQVPVEPAVEGRAAVSPAVEEPAAGLSQVPVEPAVEGLAAGSGHSAVSSPADREIPAADDAQSALLSLSPAMHAGTTPASTASASSFKDILSTPKIVRKVTTRKSTNKRALVLCKEDVRQAPPEKKGKTKQQSKKTDKGSKKKTQKKSTKGETAKKPATAVDVTPCSSCGRLYDDIEFADFEWRQCLTCSKWFHEICDELCYTTGICSACQKYRRRRS